MKRRALAVAVQLLGIGIASGDDITQPLISPDDHGTDGFAARYALRASAGATYFAIPDATADLLSVQVFIGPQPRLLEHHAFRVRWVAADASDTSARSGPLTLALQHYTPVDPIVQAPLLALHFGLEGALSTPWLSDREAAPPAAIGALGVDTELANNGWSFRAGGYARLDFLACRNYYLEVGASPELFAPSRGSNLVALHYRAAFGLDLGCDHRNLSQIYRPGLMAEYRARGIVYAGDADPSHDGQVVLGGQWVIGRLTLGVVYGFDPGASDHHLFGIRLQGGMWRNR